MADVRKKKRPLIVFILGPTGAGKSNFAVKLAKKVGGEIISCDSMQVYKGMAIISQYPVPKQLKAVPHHLVGVLSPANEWSAAEFMQRARRIVNGIVRRRRIPIIAGGSGLYARAFIRGLFPSPPKDERIRKRLYKEAEKKGSARLYERLLKLDPAYASKINSGDMRRIVRALEVYELTGRPISEEHRQTRGIEGEYRPLVFVLTRNRRELYDRINKRVERMFADGIVREVKKLNKKKMSLTANAALGYREVNGYINKDYGLETAKELLKRNTRRYAKRQLTWFRKEENAVWLELGTKKRELELVNSTIQLTLLLAA
jgi:tRNA dimethylallyltransferase